MSFLENSADIYGDEEIVPVCPSVTHWTAHERACLTFFKGHRHFLNALSVCYNERKEPESLGLFIQATSPLNVATILMLFEVFKNIRPLLLYFQKNQGSICLSEAQTYVNITLHNLDVAVETRHFFTVENFNNMKSVATEETLNLPPGTRTRVQPFIFDEFKTNTYEFVVAFKAELNEAFSQLWSPFAIFDPRTLPEDIASLTLHGDDDLSKLLDHYGARQCDTFQGTTVDQEPDVNPDMARTEWPNFKHLMFLKRKEHRERYDMMITNAKTEEEQEALKKEKERFGPHQLWSSIKVNNTCQDIFPHCYKLLYFLLLFPLSTACVERFFSKMKLVKTRLRNQLKQTSLENLLFIVTEIPKNGFGDDVFEHFVDELKRRNRNMRMDL